MSSKSPTTIQFYIPNDQGPNKKAEIQREAEAREMSVSVLLLVAYEEYIKNHPKGGKK